MSVWEKYSKEQRDEYIQFLQVYGALSNLFKQKQGSIIPYLDSKFQETVYAKVFNSQNIDIGNTPHDILSVFGNERIGIGIKTWMKSTPSFQKVMQLKRFKSEIEQYEGSPEELAYKISEIKNERLRQDYARVDLEEDKNIYHYVTRDAGKFIIQETLYPLVDLEKLRDFKSNGKSIEWSDGNKKYKYTFGDSQIWQHFDSSRDDTLILNQFDVDIIDDPFDFLLKSYLHFLDDFSKQNNDQEIVEVYLPLYSYRTKEVAQSSGLNAWNSKPKNSNTSTSRPTREIYIPIPREFHSKFPDFFCKDIFEFEKRKNEYKLKQGGESDPDVLRFKLQLPNGKQMPALITQDNMKALQSGSLVEVNPDTGRKYGQSDLGEWLLNHVLDLKEGELVTKDWLIKKGTDSVRLWRKKDDYSVINIDFAPVGSFEAFMSNEELVDDL